MPQAMATEIQKQCETIEECYEFTLSYAARGLANDEGSELQGAFDARRGGDARPGTELRGDRCARAACASRQVRGFFAVLKRDAESALAAMELVLAQPAIGSQLIDNLNASIHLRALLADLFLVTEILEAQQK